MDWTKPTAMLLGRYQPWHKGHRKLLKRALSKTGQVVILLRASDGSSSNPYSFEQRKEKILLDIIGEKWYNSNTIEILEVPNITNIVYGRDVGYKIEQEHFTEDIEEISATAIRNGFTQENNIKNN